MSKIKVFVSSAMGELEYEREAARKVIQDLHLQPIIFEGLPAMSKDLEDVYLDEVRNCDVFVLILWKSLRPAVLTEYREAMRTNRSILIFVKLLRENEERESTLARFLGGIRQAGESGPDNIHIHFYKHYRSLADLEKELKRGIIGEIERKLSETPIITTTREELYELATSIVQFAHRRLYVMQRTPSLFFEAKGFFETNFRKALTDWIERAMEDQARELVYLYSPQQTIEAIEIQSLDQRSKENIRQVIQKYKIIEAETGRRIRFSSLPGHYQGPVFGVGDNRFAIWFTGEEDAVAISYVNRRIADGFVSVFKQLVSRITSAEDLARELGFD